MSNSTMKHRKTETVEKSKNIDSVEVKQRNNTLNNISESNRNHSSSSSIPNNNNNKNLIKESGEKLNELSTKWKNLIIRTIFGAIMINGFMLMILGGPIMLIIIVLISQLKCFDEIITIGYQVYNIKKKDLLWFRKLSWYFVFVINYFLFGEIFFDYFLQFKIKMTNNEYLVEYLIEYHKIISFLLYFLGIVLFVISLKKEFYRKQFSLFAWIHISLLTIVVQCYLHIQNIIEGMIWFIIPVAMITINDLMAYICGFFFGRTPLIKLSPKKTWEGFLGGGISTIIVGVLLSAILCEFKFFTCPMEYTNTIGQISINCEPLYVFIKKEYTFFQYKFMMYPFVLHSVILGIVSSIIGPFGGFFASGFKRAFKVKDFGDTIPGHGGFMDRCDSQCLMGTFVNVYISSFIKKPSPTKLLTEILNLKTDQQLFILNSLNKLLEIKNK